MEIIHLEEVSKAFGKNKAVSDVSFSVEKGRIFGLLGPNGAGKTTTIRMINNILAPDTGSITINGQTASPATQKMIGYMPEERGLYKKMKVGEQLLYLTQLKGMETSAAKKAINFWLIVLAPPIGKRKKYQNFLKGCRRKFSLSPPLRTILIFIFSMSLFPDWIPSIQKH